MPEILFLIPARLTRPYFNRLYCECENHIYKRFREEHRPILRCIPQEREVYDENSVIDILEREFRQSQEIGLLVVAPTASRQFTIELAEDARKRQRQKPLPIIALSLGFHFPEEFTNRGITVPPAVLCDSAAGTEELATRAAVELRRQRHNGDTRRVVLIPGHPDRSDSKLRLKHFRSGLVASGLNLEFIELKPCHWQRQPAHDEMKTLIKQSDHPIDLVFAANDEMALGARDAIRHPSAAAVAGNCLVYGFDAIAEVCSLIDNDDHFLKGTIEQHIPKMAESLADLIDRVMTPNPARPPKDEEVKPICIHARADDSAIHFEDFESVVPKLVVGSAEWVSVQEAARLVDVEPVSLKDYRKPSQGGRSSDDHTYGIDGSGRCWRKDGGGNYYYWKRTLNKERR